MSRIKSIIDSLNDGNSIGPELIEGTSPLIKGVDISQIMIPESVDDDESEDRRKINQLNGKFVNKKEKNRKSQSMMKSNENRQINSKDALKADADPVEQLETIKEQFL